MSIVAVAMHHERAIKEFEADFERAGESRIPAWFADPSWSQEDRVARVNGWSEGRFLPAGWKPCTTRFYERAGELLGVVNVRHVLDERMRRLGGHVGYSVCPSARRQGISTALLAAGLEVLGDLGVDQALLTCDQDNTGSIRIIEGHGGVPTAPVVREDGITLRFWVPVP